MEIKEHCENYVAQNWHLNNWKDEIIFKSYFIKGVPFENNHFIKGVQYENKISKQNNFDEWKHFILKYWYVKWNLNSLITNWIIIFKG